MAERELGEWKTVARALQAPPAARIPGARLKKMADQLMGRISLKRLDCRSALASPLSPWCFRTKITFLQHPNNSKPQLLFGQQYFSLQMGLTWLICFAVENMLAKRKAGRWEKSCLARLTLVSESLLMWKGAFPHCYSLKWHSLDTGVSII